MKSLVLLGIMISITSILCVLAVLVPASRPVLFPENEIVENLTAIFYLAAFATSIFHIRIHKIAYLISLFGLFGLLEELSYGKFIFNFSFNKYYGLDLPNLHNFVQLPYFAFKDNTAIATAMLIAFSAATLIATYMIYSRRHHFNSNPAAPYLLVFIVLIIGALTLDMGIAYNRFFPYMEELLELNSSLVLMFGAISLNTK